MAHLARYLIISDDSYFHVTWQCHNKQFLLESDWARRVYYSLLLANKDKYGVTIYAYCFMSNHPHLVGHCRERELLSRFFQKVNSSFAKALNKRLGRRGQIVMDRFKSPCIQTSEYLFEVWKYVELNPVRAEMVSNPKDYHWSSYRFYAFGEADALVTAIPCYESLGDSPKERQDNYRKIIKEILLAEGHLQPKNYSSVYFIGDPGWILTRYQVLKEKMKALRAAQKLWWEDRQKDSSG
jgi:putative transposase